MIQTFTQTQNRHIRTTLPGLKLRTLCIIATPSQAQRMHMAHSPATNLRMMPKRIMSIVNLQIVVPDTVSQLRLQALSRCITILPQALCLTRFICLSNPATHHPLLKHLHPWAIIRRTSTNIPVSYQHLRRPPYPSHSILQCRLQVLSISISHFHHHNHSNTRNTSRRHLSMSRNSMPLLNLRHQHLSTLT
jgi:hypothetical protein